MSQNSLAFTKVTNFLIWFSDEIFYSDYILPEGAVADEMYDMYEAIATSTSTTEMSTQELEVHDTPQIRSNFEEIWIFHKLNK